MQPAQKKRLSERDICTKFITPAITGGGKWDVMSQVTELMSWCDQLAAEQSAAALRDSSLHALLAPVD